MNTIALLPVKAHSERVPGKNFRLLCGKPLWTWVLETLLQTKAFSEILVDTDSPELIAALNQQYPGVRTVLRPEHLRGDGVSMNDLIAHDISLCPQGQVFFQTHATNPLLSDSTVLEALDTFSRVCGAYDALFSVNRIQSRTYWKDGSPINHTLGKLARTQDLEPVFEENSNFFIFTPAAFHAAKSRLGTRPYLFETPPMRSLEIDEPEDFDFVELVMKGLLEAENHG